MSVRLRGTSFQADFTFKGRRYRKDFETKQEAEHWETESRFKLNRGEEIEVTPRLEATSVSTMEELFTATYERHWKGTKAESTALINANTVLDIIGRTLSPSKVTPQVIDSAVGVMQKRGLTGSTINRKLSALSKMLNHGYSRGWIPYKPHIEKRAESECRMRWLTEDEELTVLKWFEDRGLQDMFDLTAFLLDTGCRLSEGLGVTWVDTEDSVIRLWGDTKTKKHCRAIPQTLRVRGIIKRRWASLKDQNKLFGSMTKRHAQNWWQMMRADIGKQDDAEFVLHALRHTFGSRLAQRGEDLLAIQRLMGHRCIQMTMRYTKLHATNLTAAVRKLDGGYTGKTPVNPAFGHGDTSSDRVTEPVAMHA